MKRKLNNVGIGVWFIGILAMSVSSIGQAMDTKICEKLKRMPEPSIRIVHGGHVVENVWLGDLEAKQHVQRPSSVDIFAFHTYSNLQGSCGRACLSLKPKKSPCKNWAYYEGAIQFDPAVFGSGKFEDGFRIDFGHGEQDDGMYFSASGRFHGGWLVAHANSQTLAEWFAGRTRTLPIEIRNTGDRDVYTKGVGVGEENPLKVQISKNSCDNITLSPGQQCQFTMTADTAKLNKKKKNLFIASIASDAIGDGNGLIFIEYEPGSSATVFLRAGYSSESGAR